MPRGEDTSHHPNRRVGRTSLPRLTTLITMQLDDESRHHTAFSQGHFSAVKAGLERYRQDRDSGDPIRVMNSIATAHEIRRRFADRLPPWED